MTRSLTLAAVMTVLFSGHHVASAQIGQASAIGRGCGCTSTQTGEYSTDHFVPRATNVYDGDRCGSGGCSLADSRYSPQYDRLSDPRYRSQNKGFDSSYGSPLPRFDSGSSLPTIPQKMSGIARLSLADQHAALRQRTCPVTRQPLGSMGMPIRVTAGRASIFVCCQSCVSAVKSNPEQYLSAVSPDTRSFSRGQDDFRRPSQADPGQQRHSVTIPPDMEGVALLSVVDQEAALRQRTCPVTKQPLGSMGKPIRVNVAGRSVFVCCDGCVNTLKSNPARYLSTAQRPPVEYVR